MGTLYTELTDSFNKFKDNFVFENRLTYSQLLADVESTNYNLKPCSIFLAELDSGEIFIKTLLSALKAKLIFCPIAKDSGDLIKSESVLKPNLVFKNDFNYLHETLDQRIVKLCPDGGFVRFTSGTTGDSKGVLISSKSASERINLAANNFKLSPTDKVLFLMSMPYHFVTSILMMLKSGVSFTSNPLEATVIYGTPYHFQNLLSAKLPKLRLAVSTSTHLPQITAEQFYEKFNIPIRQSFGIIEIGLPIGDFINSKQDSVGKILEGYELKFIGAENEGILAIKGPGMFDAYLEPFQERDSVLQDGWFLTGDYAYRDPNGDIFIKGRNTSAIHLGGFKVFPEEIEDILLKYKDILDVQVCSETHEIYGNTIVAKIVATADIDQKLLRKFCKENLGIIKTPKKFEFVDAIAKTRTGKLQRAGSK